MKESPTAARPTYRHGDLRRALVDAGVALARTAGPEGVALREATRRAGVAPNAAYRHFANHAALFDAVRTVALSEMARAMERHLERLGAPSPDLDYARQALHAVGLAYLEFARNETGLFRTAFAVRFDAAEAPAGRSGHSGLNPFQLLSAALDRLVAAGGMPAAKRPRAEFLAWSAVHGLAMLSIDGPLRHASSADRAALDQRVVDMVELGLRGS